MLSVCHRLPEHILCIIKFPWVAHIAYALKARLKRNQIAFGVAILIAPDEHRHHAHLRCAHKQRRRKFVLPYLRDNSDDGFIG